MQEDLAQLTPCLGSSKFPSSEVALQTLLAQPFHPFLDQSQLTLRDNGYWWKWGVQCTSAELTQQPLATSLKNQTTFQQKVATNLGSTK